MFRIKMGENKPSVYVDRFTDSEVGENNLAVIFVHPNHALRIVAQNIGELDFATSRGEFYAGKDCLERFVVREGIAGGYLHKCPDIYLSVEEVVSATEKRAKDYASRLAEEARRLGINVEVVEASEREKWILN